MFIGGTAGAVLALLVFGAVYWQRLDQISAKVELDRSSAQASLERGSAGSVKKVGATSRPVYRYSVVPGGVRTPNDLIAAMASDSAVAEHYATVNKAMLTTGRLNAPLQAHVSYRIGDRVYWTKKKLTLQPGEQVLTDGQTLVRGRCGNKISIAPLLPTLDNEPPPETFDLVVAPLFPTSMVRLEPGPSYFTPQSLKTPEDHVAGGPSENPPAGAAFLGAPPVAGVVPGSSSNPPSENETPFGLPPGGIPPGNPPGPGLCLSISEKTANAGNRPAAIPTCPPGNPPGPPPGGPPPDITPPDVPVTPTPVPEPGTLVLLGSGAAVLLARRIRKQTRG